MALSARIGKADLPLQPQSGSILQPKVGVAATLGPGGDDFPNPERVVPGWIESKMKHIAFNTGATALRLTDPISFGSQRSRNGNVGLKDATASRLIAAQVRLTYFQLAHCGGLMVLTDESDLRNMNSTNPLKPDSPSVVAPMHRGLPR